MQIYLVQGHVKQAEKPYTARIWCSSQAQAANARSRLRSDLNVAREDIRTTAVDLDTRRDPLLNFLNQVTGVDAEGFLDLEQP